MLSERVQRNIRFYEDEPCYLNVYKKYNIPGLTTDQEKSENETSTKEQHINMTVLKDEHENNT